MPLPVRRLIFREGVKIAIGRALTLLPPDSQRAMAIGTKNHAIAGTKKDLPRFSDQWSVSFLHRAINHAGDNAIKFLRAVSWSLISNYSTPH